MVKAAQLSSFLSLLAACGCVLGDKVKDIHITTPTDLIQLSKNVNSGITYKGTTVILDADLDFSGGFSEQFEPIGEGDDDYDLNAYYHFQGTFDGQNYVISNLAVKARKQRVGLFGYIKDAVVRNVIMDSSCSVACAYVSGYPSISIGGIAALISDNTVVENCVNMAKVNFVGSAPNGNLAVGGIVGGMSAILENSVTVRNCVNYGSVSVDTSVLNIFMGGIVGYSSSHSESRIQNCLNYGSLSQFKTYERDVFIGDILGQAYYEASTALENCVGSGNITLSYGQKGGLIGAIMYNAIVNIKNCGWTNDANCANIFGYAQDGSTILIDRKTSKLSPNVTALNNLNAYALSNNWNRWLLNENNKQVTFKVNDSKGFTVSSKFVVLPDPVERAGHIFKGWFVDSACTIPFTAKTVTKDITVYAKI